LKELSLPLKRSSLFVFLGSTKSRETLTSHSLEVRPLYLDHRIIDWLRGPLHPTMHGGPRGVARIFCYFMNEYVLRFLNLRYPSDYNTVPRPAFWGLHLLLLYPWSA